MIRATGILVNCSRGTPPDSKEGIVKLTDCRLLPTFLHEAKPLKSPRAAIGNSLGFRSESG